jgi:hypothetical protein
MSYTYNSYVTQLANLMAVSPTDTSFVTWLPGCIDYAEQRIYRELDLLATLISDSSGQLTTGTRLLTLPTTTGVFIDIENVAVLSPAGSTTTNGTRTPLVPVSLAVIDLLWPTNNVNTGTPTMFAMRGTDSTTNSPVIVVGPPPDGAYYVEIRGTQRPAPLSLTNQTTVLTTYIPDVFMAASMVYASGFMRNFGAQADDPRMSQSWESQYQTLVKSAEVEVFRSKFQSQSWSSQKPTPANPPRN